MARFDYYVIEKQLAIFALIVGALVTIIWINLAARGFSEFFSDTQAVSLLLRYVLYELPPSLFQSLSLAAYATSVYVACRMIEDNEFSAIQSVGTSSIRIMRPFAIFGLLMAVFGAILVHDILPDSLSNGAALRARMQADLAQFRIRHGQFLFPAEGVAVYVRNQSESGELEKVFIHQDQSFYNNVTHFSDTARLLQYHNSSLLEMQAGVTQLWDPNTKEVRVVGFDKLRFNLSEFAKDFGGAQAVRYTNTVGLIKEYDRSVSPSHPTNHVILVELYRRLSYSMTAFLFPVIGATAVAASHALGIRFSVPIVVSLVGIVSVYLSGEFLRNSALAFEVASSALFLPPLIAAIAVLALLGISQRPGALSLLSGRKSV